jgi:hypothetical protein
MTSANVVLHRTGAIEVWDRGTNRVVEACRAYGIADATFTEALGRRHGDVQGRGRRRRTGPKAGWYRGQLAPAREAA